MLAEVPNFPLALKQNTELTKNIVSMLIEPLSIPLAECWEINYPEVADYSNYSFFQENPQMATRFMQSEENKKMINFFLFRSYKLAQVLSVSYNLKCVLAHSENFLDEFFRTLEQELQEVDENEKLYNIEIIADLIINIVRLEPYATYNYLLFYNIPFLFARFLHKSKVFDLLSGLVIPSNLFFETTEDMANKYWNYYKQSDFFVELFNVAEKGGRVPKNKTRSAYKPIRIPEMSKLIVGGQMPEKLKLKAFSAAARSAVKTTVGIMVEDQKFIAADIDLVKKYLKEVKGKIQTTSKKTLGSDSRTAPNPKSRQLVRTGTLELLPDEDSIIQSMKANLPINANFNVVFTSPEKLACIEPFKVKRAEATDLSKVRKDSAKTHKTSSRKSRMSVL